MNECGRALKIGLFDKNSMICKSKIAKSEFEWRGANKTVLMA